MSRRERTRIGESNVRVMYLNALKRAWRERRLVFFLGAGVSAPYGLSNWSDLVLELLLNKSRKFDQFWPHYRKALAMWMTDQFDFSPLALARVVKYKLRKSSKGKSEDVKREAFLEQVRESLYRNLIRNPTEPTTLQAIAKLVAKSEKAKGGPHVPAIFTLNFDDMLEQELKKVEVKSQISYNAARRSDSKLPVIHVHGYLPQKGPLPKADLVFSEDEYHKISYSVFHWALADIINWFRN
jgi:SIR2-like domain